MGGQACERCHTQEDVSNEKCGTVLHCTALYCATILRTWCTALCCTVLQLTYCTVLCCTVPQVMYRTQAVHNAVPQHRVVPLLQCPPPPVPNCLLLVAQLVLYLVGMCCAILYCTVLHCTILYCTVLCCAVLTVLCCTVLYCTTVLYFYYLLYRM